MVTYTDPTRQPLLTKLKQWTIRRILRKLAKCGQMGKLLDVGCSTGLFMLAAQKAGWTVTGFDPNEALVEIACRNGLDVRLGWSADQCGYSAGQFQAVVVIDVFYYNRSPLEDLRAFWQFLRPGGILVMRISNKRCILGLTREWVEAEQDRNDMMSQILLGQFHTISPRSLTKVLKKTGFHDIEYLPHASTSRFTLSTWKTQIIYLVASVIWLATLGHVDFSPGVLVIARKLQCP